MKLSYTFLLLLCFILVDAQSFEGIVHYQMTIDNPNPEIVPNEKFFSKLGKTKLRKVKFYIKGNQYKSYNKTTKTIEHYDPDTNQIYFYSNNNQDTALVVNALEKYERISDSRTEATSEKIKGLECQVLIIEGFKAVNKYYYNKDKYPVDKKLFERHHFGHLAEYYEQANALPLKIEMKNFIRKIEWKATRIRKKRLSAKHFELPAFKELIPSEFVYGTFNLYGGY